ncbi:MAG: Rossmann-like and DUF2520 domain-containing protein [Balneolaceae bacterium]
MAKPTVTIIGLGNVGSAWLNVLPKVGYKVISAYSRKKADSSLVKNQPEIKFSKGLPAKKEELGLLVILAVSDDAIKAVSEGLADNFSGLEDKYFVHCSGVLTSEALSALKRKGAKTASFHPIKAITKANSTFKDTWFDMEGNEELLAELEELCVHLEAHAFPVKPEAKAYLHASAVVASNYLVVLADMLSKISAKGGVSEESAIKAFAPLMRNTLSNIEEFGVSEALTGPIARGDVETVRSHLKGLENENEILSLYKEMGRAAVEIAGRKSGNYEALAEIKKLLS